MTSTVRNVAFDCADPYQRQFWSAITGHPLDDEDRPGDPEAQIVLPGGPTLFFNQVPEGKPDEPRTDDTDHAAGLLVTAAGRLPSGTGNSLIPR